MPEQSHLLPDRQRPSETETRSRCRHRLRRGAQKVDRGCLLHGRNDGPAGLVYRPGRTVPDSAACRIFLASRGRPAAATARVLPRQHGQDPHPVPPGRQTGPGQWHNDLSEHRLAERIQRVLNSRALDGLHPTEVASIMGWFEAAARHGNAVPTPFLRVGRPEARRRRQIERRHRLGGSHPDPNPSQFRARLWPCANQVIHYSSPPVHPGSSRFISVASSRRRIFVLL